MPFIDCSNSFQNNGLKHGPEMKVLMYAGIWYKNQVGTSVYLNPCIQFGETNRKGHSYQMSGKMFAQLYKRFVIIITFVLISMLCNYFYSGIIKRSLQQMKFVDQLFSISLKENFFDLYALGLKNASDFDPFLTPEPPVPGMDFIAQKPGKSHIDFPPGIEKGHPYLKARTYPNEARNDSCSGCFPYIYHNVLNVEGCGDLPSIKILILVTTIPKEIAIRTAIRETWGRNTNTTRSVFVFGVGWSSEEQEILLDESILYGDILQDNYIDSYFNLSLKVLSGYHWWSKNCENAPFVLRTAGDNFVNTPHILHLLSSKPSWPRKIIGYCFKARAVWPIRAVRSKFYVTLKEYPYDKYIAYCIGTSFITPASTVNLILETSPNVPYFVMEDVYFGMVMVNGQNASGIMNIQGFNSHYKIKDEHGKSKCEAPPDMMSIHNVKSPELMYWIWRNCLS